MQLETLDIIRQIKNIEKEAEEELQNGKQDSIIAVDTINDLKESIEIIKKF